MLGKVVVPIRTRARSGDQLLDNRLALRLIKRKRIRDAATAVERLHQRDRIFHREPRTGTDGEVRGVERIPDQHHVAERPALVPQPWEVAPYRLVGDERMAAERIGEYALENGF